MRRSAPSSPPCSTTSAPRTTGRSRAADPDARPVPVADPRRAGYLRGILRRLPPLAAALTAALILAAPAGAASFDDPFGVGDNTGLNSLGENVTAPDISSASHALLDDGRIELAYFLKQPTIGVCRTHTGDVDTDVAARPQFALYTDSTAVASPDFRILYDQTAQSYVVRDNTTTHPNIARIEGIDVAGSITIHLDPKYIGKPQQLRWMASQTCRGRLPYEDVEVVPNTGFYTLDLPFPPKPDPAYDPPTQGTPDPLPDALPPTTSAAQVRLTAGATAAVKRLAAGIPNAGVTLSFTGLPAGNVLVMLGTTTLLARGSADTKAGRATVHLKPTKAGRRLLHGAGTLGTRLKFVFSPRGGGKQTTILRRVTLKRRR